MQGRIRLIITAEAETRDDGDDRKGCQRIRRWRRGAIETASAEVYQRGKKMSKKYCRMMRAAEDEDGSREAG